MSGNSHVAGFHSKLNKAIQDLGPRIQDLFYCGILSMLPFIFLLAALQSQDSCYSSRYQVESKAKCDRDTSHISLSS